MPGTGRIPRWARRPLADVLNAAWDWASVAGSVGARSRRAARFGAFGEGSLIGFPPGVMYNERWIRIGSGTMIGPQVTLAVGMAAGQQMVSDPVVSIGDRTLIGRGSNIIGHFSIEIGDDIQTGPYVYITDQNHTYSDPEEPIGRQWPTESPVVIGSGSWLGTGVVVLPGAHIGRHVVVGAGSVVTGTLPDRCVAVGVPARVVRHWEPGDGWVSGPAGPPAPPPSAVGPA